MIALLAIFRLVFLCEVNLVVDGVVIIPIFLPIDIVSDTEEHCFVFEIGLVFKLDTESKTIAAIFYLLLADIGVVLRHDFGRCLPVVEGESCHN